MLYMMLRAGATHTDQSINQKIKEKPIKRGRSKQRNLHPGKGKTEVSMWRRKLLLLGLRNKRYEHSTNMMTWARFRDLNPTCTKYNAPQKQQIKDRENGYSNS